ncbi:MAG TPA: hypothetical protein VFN68_02995 [Acidimicrobiales bacterium]|nr:hypothetical protein [Acidimicrobiales bacterium]
MNVVPDPALTEAAERLERQAPGYLSRVRRLAADLGLPPTPAARVVQAIGLVDDTAQVNADAPTQSNRAAGRYLKTGIGVLVRWYMLHLSGQVSNLGGSVSWMGRALYDYTAGLESEVTRLRAEVDELRSRVDQMAR